MLEEYLVTYCSPTLAALKTANMFNWSFRSQKEQRQQIKSWNEQLSPKGISITVLREGEEKALLYVYRKKRLERDLKRSEVAEFLRQRGYENLEPEQALKRLKERFSPGGEFPAARFRRGTSPVPLVYRGGAAAGGSLSLLSQRRVALPSPRPGASLYQGLRPGFSCKVLPGWVRNRSLILTFQLACIIIIFSQILVLLTKKANGLVSIQSRGIAVRKCKFGKICDQGRLPPDR